MSLPSMMKTPVENTRIDDFLSPVHAQLFATFVTVPATNFAASLAPSRFRPTL